MTFRKNWLSILIWVPFSLVVFCLFGLALYESLPQIPFVNTIYLQIGLTALAFVLSIVFFIGIRKLSKKKLLKNTLLIEALLFAVLFGAGVFVRCFYMCNTTESFAIFEEAVYFDTAKVTGGAIAPIAHGAQYFYVILLRGLFWLFGNHFLAGMILQIVLQCLACISWYIGIRKLSGPGAGLIFMAGNMLLPQSVISGITYSPKYMYLLLWGLVLLIIANVLKGEYNNKPFKWYSCITRFLLGICVGFLVYLDITGFILLIPVFALIFVGRNPKEATLPLKQKVFRVALQTVTVLLGTFLSLTVYFSIDAWQCGNAIEQVVNVWLSLFTYKGIGDVPGVFMYEPATWAHIAILFLMVLGVFAFFARKKAENQLVWMFMLLAGFGIHFGSFYASGMNCDALLLFLILALTGAGVQALVKKDNIPITMGNTLIDTNTEEVNEVTYQEFDTKTEAVPPTVITEDKETTENVTVSEPVQTTGPVNSPDVPSPVEASVETEMQEEKPKFIENPLPLPKKHVKKTMDYGIEIPADKMEFDIETSDMDDFDIL